MAPFPGFPEFLDRAAAELGPVAFPEPARRVAALAAMANLCAQAIAADEAHVEGILARAAEFRDQLRVACRAAELMLDDARSRRGLVPPPRDAGPRPAPGPARRGRGPSA